MAENTDRNKSLQYSKNDVLSVSGEYGIVNQIALQGRSFAGVSVADYHVVETNDVVYTKSPLKANPYGIIKHNSGVPGIVSTLYAVYHPKSCAISQFIDYYFQNDLRLNKYLKPLVNIGAKHDMKINNEVALTGDVIFPSVDEQAKIVDFLKLIDEKIAKQKQLVEALKSYKRGVSTAIFNESLHIGSDSKWKEFSLGDFCTVVMGQSPDSTTYNNDGLGLPLVQGNADIYEGVTWPQHFTSAPTKIATANSILLSVRAPVGSVSIANQTVCIGRGVCSITSENMDFLYQLLVHIQDKWKKIEQGGTFTAISGDDIRRFRVTIPCVSDQIIIGSFLGAIDSLINNNKAICVALSKLKSAFLQILFI